MGSLTMDWTSFIGHHRQRSWFQNAVRKNRLASTFLLVGPSGIGKRTFAHLLAKTMLCTGSDPAAFAPCCRCEACAQVAALTHPDVIDVHREKENSIVTMEQLVGSKDARMREGLCYELRMRPYSGRRKIAIIDDVDTLAVEGANSLLKTLEEPPAGSLIFLIGTSEQRQLPTIRSRSQVVRFNPLSSDELAVLIQRLELASSPEDAARIASRAQGSIESAKHALDPSLEEFREQLLRELTHQPLDFPRLCKSIIGHLDSVATDGPVRRERLKWILDEVTSELRTGMHAQLGREGAFSSHRAPSSFRTLTREQFLTLIQRTQQAREHVDRNIGAGPLLESWGAALSAAL